MYCRAAAGSSAIVLIAIVLFAGAAALGVPIPRDVYMTVTSLAVRGEHSVESLPDRPGARRDAVRTAILRAAGSAISRPSAPGGAGSGSSRGGAALGVASMDLVPVALAARGRRIDVRRDGVPREARSTPPSRAPPLT